MQEHGQHLARGLGSKKISSLRAEQCMFCRWLTSLHRALPGCLMVMWLYFFLESHVLLFPGGSDLSGAHGSSSSQSEPFPGTVIGS